MIRYPTYHVVIDHLTRDGQAQPAVVYESRSRALAHATCDALNDEHHRSPRVPASALAAASLPGPVRARRETR